MVDGRGDPTAGHLVLAASLSPAAIAVIAATRPENRPSNDQTLSQRREVCHRETPCLAATRNLSPWADAMRDRIEVSSPWLLWERGAAQTAG
jgi:hypothetical protein